MPTVEELEALRAQVAALKAERGPTVQDLEALRSQVAELRSQKAQVPSASELPEITTAPELNEISSRAFLANAGLLSATDLDEQASILKAQLGEDVEILEDADLNLVARTASGDFAVNRPGLSPRDVSQFLARAAAFIPSGKVSGTFMRKTGEAAAKTAGTEAALQGVESATGGEFNASEVATEAAIGGGFQLGSDILLGSIDAIKTARKNAQISAETGVVTDAEQAQRALEPLAGKESGVRLSRAQQLNDPFLLQEQAFLAQMPEGARPAIKFIKGQNAEVAQEVEGFVRQFGSSQSVVSGSRVLRDSAAKAIELKKLARQEKASPLYKRAFQLFRAGGNKVDTQPVLDFVEERAAAFPERHPAAVALRAFADDVVENAGDLERLQGVKEIADVKLANMTPDSSKGAKPSAIRKAQRALAEAESLLLKQMDSASDDFRQARETFAKESGPVDTLRNSIVGVLADIPDERLQGVASRLFAPENATADVVKQARRAIEATPNGNESWQGIVRTELERRLGSVRTDALESGADTTLENLPSQLRRALFPNEKARRVLFAALSPEQKESAQFLEQVLIRASSGRDVGSQTGIRNEIRRRFDRGLVRALVRFVGSPIEGVASIGEEATRSERIAQAAQVMFDPDWAPEMNRIRKLAGSDQFDKFLEAFTRGARSFLPEAGSVVKVGANQEENANP